MHIYIYIYQILSSTTKPNNEIDLINTSVMNYSHVHSALKHKTRLRATARQVANKQSVTWREPQFCAETTREILTASEREENKI